MTRVRSPDETSQSRRGSSTRAYGYHRVPRRSRFVSSLLLTRVGRKGLGWARWFTYAGRGGRQPAAGIYAAAVSRVYQRVGNSCVVLLYKIRCYHVRRSFPFPRNLSSRYPGIWKLKVPQRGILAFADYVRAAERKEQSTCKTQTEKDMFLYRRIRALQQICQKKENFISILKQFRSADSVCSFELSTCITLYRGAAVILRRNI